MTFAACAAFLSLFKVRGCRCTCLMVKQTRRAHVAHKSLLSLSVIMLRFKRSSNFLTVFLHKETGEKNIAKVASSEGFFTSCPI